MYEVKPHALTHR